MIWQTTTSAHKRRSNFRRRKWEFD